MRAQVDVDFQWEANEEGTKMRVVPIGRKYLVKRDPRQTETAGGLAIPEDAQRAPLWGTVVEVGDGFYAYASGPRPTGPVRAGQRVLFGPYAGVETTVNGEKDFLILDEKEVLAVEVE